MNANLTDDPEMQRLISRQQLLQNINRVQGICWDKCMHDGVDSYLSSRQETCLSNCTDRFVDLVILSTQRFNQRLGDLKMKNIKQKKVEILKEEPIMTRTVQEMHAESDKRVGQVFQTMLIFTALMVLGPISTYFLSKVYVFEKYFTVSKDESYIYSAISAVVVVHIILGAFIYVAWKDANAAAHTKKNE